MKLKRPFLACSRNVLPEDLQSLQYPLYGTPKLDGIRMLIIHENKKPIAVSRKLKPIPNALIQTWAQENRLPEGLDGEIIIPNATFHEIQSKVMTSYTLPFPFRYVVFDNYKEKGGYIDRMNYFLFKKYIKIPENLRWLSPTTLPTMDAVLDYEKLRIDKGDEGIILRSGDGPYKQGRSTWKQGYMLKMKRFEDCEGTIVRFEEKLHNANPKTIDETGYAKRSKHLSGLKGAGTMGKMIVLTNGKEVTLGGGWDAAFALKVWENQEDYYNLIVTYKKQSHGEKDNPRCATFKGIRYD